MIKTLLLVIIGVFIIVESVVSLFWKFNDKSFTGQFARSLRVACGVGIVILGVR